MPRKPVVSRTMQLLQVLTLRTDTVREKVKHESFFIYDEGFKVNEDILKYIREEFDDERLITSRIKAVTKVTALVTQSPQAFLNNAENIIIKGETKNEQS